MGNIAQSLYFSLTRKLPMIHQTEISECGLACLAMIASYHGYQTDLLTLRRQFDLSQRGCRLSDLMDWSHMIHLLSRAVKLELEEMKHLRLPCILHWDMNHFVVLKKVRGKSIVLHDPAIGVVRYSIKEASAHFTGVALELTPAVDFEKIKNRTTLFLSDLWSSITGLKLPLFQVVLLSVTLEIFALVNPLLMQLVIDDVIVTRDFPLLYLIAIGLGLLTIIQGITTYVRSWIVLFLSNVLNIQLVANLANHLFKLPLDFFQKRHLGDILSRFGSLGSIQNKLSTDFAEGIVDGVMAIATVAVMFFYSPLLTCVVLLALLSYITARAIFYPTLKRLNQESLVISAKENSFFMESIRAILPLKIFSKELQRENVWKNYYAERLNVGIKVSKWGLIYKGINQAIFGVEYIAILLIGAGSVMTGTFTIGMLMAYLSYRQQLVGSSIGLIDKVVSYRLISVDLERVADIALTAPEQKSDSDHQTISRVITGQFVVKDLSFRYSEKEPYLFNHLSFSIEPGESIALVGKSGCGKTTLIKLMMSLLSPSQGEILIDGLDITKIGFKNYRSQIAAVMQEDILLSGSIAENISFFDPERNQERVEACAMIAAIHEEINQMSMAYTTLVGDMGSTLSGGQRQRILLARALYRQPKVLFLDEATSHLDTPNEDRVNQQLRELRITRVLAAHRQETIDSADRVIYLG